MEKDELMRVIEEEGNYKEFTYRDGKFYKDGFEANRKRMKGEDE